MTTLNVRVTGTPYPIGTTSGIYYLGYKVHFSEILPQDRGLVYGDNIYIPESMAYKFFFMNDQVDDTTVKMAMDHAIQKLNRFIDHLS